MTLLTPLFWEVASYVVTVFGLPYAILLFWYQSHKEQLLENEELYQALAEEYAKFGAMLAA